MERTVMERDGYDYEAMPKKRMAASALFLDTAGNVLIVKPTYRPDWLLPGGTVEENESPLGACKREIKEELHLDIPLGRLLCVEYYPDDARQTESVQFVFYGGVLKENDIHSIVLPDPELSAYQFAPRSEAMQLLSCKLAKRLPHCFQALEKNITIYLENGSEPEQSFRKE